MREEERERQSWEKRGVEPWRDGRRKARSPTKACTGASPRVSHGRAIAMRLRPGDARRWADTLLYIHSPDAVAPDISPSLL